MKICKKYLFPVIALLLSFMMLFALPCTAADEQETTKVVAQPADPEVPTPEGDSIEDILGGLFGDSGTDSEDAGAGEEIRDFADEAGGVLKVFDQILQNIRDLFGNLLNMLLNGLGGLSGGLGGGLDNLF